MVIQNLQDQVGGYHDGARYSNQAIEGKLRASEANAFVWQTFFAVTGSVAAMMSLSLFGILTSFLLISVIAVVHSIKLIALISNKYLSFFLKFFNIHLNYICKW